MVGIGGVIRYFNQVRTEMSLVTWPTRAETLRLTALVITASIVIGLTIGAVDLLFTEGFKLVIGG